MYLQGVVLIASQNRGSDTARAVKILCFEVLVRPMQGPSCKIASRVDSLAAYPPHTVITMPALSPTMQHGNIGSWQKKAGDTLAPGDVLVEIETDKAQMDFEFQEEGILAKILKESGEKDVPVGNVRRSTSTDIPRLTCYSPLRS